MTGPGQELAHRLQSKLLEDGRALCRSEALFRHWAAAVPELVGTIDHLTTLREAIDTLAAAGTLTVPRGRASWDGSFRPALPRFVLVAGVTRARRERVWRETAWREEMGWAADLRTITDANLAHLMAINEWLVATRGGKVQVVPHRVRSAEVLGDEKALDAVSKTSLFGPGRLSWGLLAAVQLEPPLAVRRVGTAGGVLVVENADPFWMAVEALDGRAGPIGLVHGAPARVVHCRRWRASGK